MAEVQVENIVFSCQVADSLDLAALAPQFSHATYTPDEAPALVVHSDEPRAALFLTQDGRVTGTGPRSLGEVDALVGMTLRRLTVFGVHTYPTPTITIERIVASTSGVPPRSLRQLARSFETIPQGRRFPGLAIKGADDTIVLLFRSGKMVGTGPTLEAVTAAFGQVADTLATQGKATRKEEERHAGSNRRKHRGIHVVF